MRGASSASRTAARPRPRTPLSAAEGAGPPGSHSSPTPRAGYITVGCQKDEVIADARAGNAVGTSSIPRPVERDGGVVGDRDLEAFVAPAHVRVQVGEQLRRPARGEPPRAVQHVGLEQRAHALPVRRERDLPVGGERVGQAFDRAPRRAQERRGELRVHALLDAHADLEAHALVRRRADRGELVLEARER